MTPTGYIELTIAFVILAFSVISIISCLIFRICYHRKIDLEYLGWGILLTALWNISNSAYGQILFHNSSVAANFAFMIMMLMPLPFFLYMNEVQRGRYQKRYRAAAILLFIGFILFSGLNFLHLRYFSDNLIPILVFFLLFVLVVLSTLVSDVCNGHVRDYFLVALGMAGIWIALFVRIISYIQRGRVNSDAALPIGLIILLLLAVINTVHELIDMERKKQQALMASEAKGKFLANMSHEIRTPINAVLGMNAMILRECTDTAIREYAMDIQNAGENLLSLINDILDLSKIESGKLEILPEEYDFSSLLHDVMNMITMKAKGKDLTVDLEIDENLPSRLWGDDIRLRQILVNIMNNAVKYTEKGGVTLTVKAADTDGHFLDDGSVDDGSPGNGQPSDDRVFALFFQVKDTGIGIRQEDLAKLFQEFQRIEEDRNRNIEGTGLGMSITTQLLELMGSKLQVESVYGEGSTFYFTLEQKVVDAEPIGNLGERIRKRATEYSYQAAFTAPEAQILVVDDNSVNRKVFSNLLKATKVMIDEAASGMECLEKVGQKQYDVIFMDHMMPDMDGIETLHRLKELENCPCHSTPVIALTANAVSGAKEMYLKEGFDSFLSKPIIPEKLEKMLTQILPEDKIVYEEITDASLADSGSSLLQPEDGDPESDLPQLDGIDWEYALLHLKDVGILKDTVYNFYLAMEREAEDLLQFFQGLQDGSEEARKQNLEQYEIKVHAMKSNAAMIGAVPLSGVAKMLEYAAKDGETEVIHAVTPVFLQEWKKMKATLGVYVENNGTDETEKPQADWNTVQEYLRRLVDAMKDMDIDTADEMADHIRGFQYPEQMVSTVEKLCLAVADIDMEQSEKWAGELTAQIEDIMI